MYTHCQTTDDCRCNHDEDPDRHAAPRCPSLAVELRDFDIPAGPAEEAVNQFGDQAHMSVLYEPGSLDNYKTRALKGKYEPIEGLRKLLEGSGLDFGGTSKQLVDVRPGRTRGPGSADGPDLPIVEIVARGSSSMLDLPPGVVIRTINSEALAAQGFTTLPDWVRSLTQNQGTPYGNPGTILDSSTGQLWGISSGQNGTHLNPGVPNEYDSYSGTWILPQQKRINGLISGSSKWSDGTEITLNGLFNMRWSKIQASALGTALVVPSTNPFYVNPVPGNTDPVQVLYGFGDDLGRIVERGTVRSGQATVGVKHPFGDNWALEGTAGYTFENQRQTQSNLVNYDMLSYYLGLDDPTLAFNPFGAGPNTNPQTTLAAIRTQGENDVKSAFRIASLKAKGSIWGLPAGPVKVTAGYDFRLQTFLSTVSPVFNSTVQAFDTDRHRTLHAFYFESGVPVLAGHVSSDTAYKLILGAGVRYEHFSDVGGATLPSLGFSFETDAGLSLSGTFARMFRPPNIPDLNESINYSAIYPLADPKSPTGYTNALIWGGNNADLRPETARSWMVGIKFSPQSDPKLTLDAQYFNIAAFNQLLPEQFLSPTVLSDAQSSYLYTRDVTPAAVDHICSHSMFVGGTGACQSSDIGAIVDLRLRSAETVKTDGVDLKVLQRWRIPSGELSADVQATYVLHFKETQAPGGAFYSYRNTPHSPTALRLRSVFRWENPWFSVSPAVNLQSSYTDTMSIPNRPVGSWMTWDLVVAYKARRLDDLIHGNTTISLRGLNIFNKQPPFLNNNVSLIGFDPENADLLGRRVSLRLEHSWPASRGQE